MCVGERLDHLVVGGAGMVALEDRAHELAVDRPPLGLEELRQLLAALGQRRAAFAGPDMGVERQPPDAVRMALREQRGAQRARRDAVHQQRAGVVAGLEDVVGRGLEVVGALGDRGVDAAVLGGAAVALHVDAPGVEALADEIVHRARMARHLQIERRLRRHRRAVHEQDGAACPGCSGRAASPTGTAWRRPSWSSVRCPGCGCCRPASSRGCSSWMLMD